MRDTDIIPLVRRALTHFLIRNRKDKYLKDDLLSEGCLAVVRKLRDIEAGKIAPQNVTAYLRRTLANVFSNMAAAQRNIVSPKGRVARRDRERLPQTEDAYLEEVPEKYDRDAAWHLRDTIDACCESDTELQIVALRAEGYTQAEVAGITGISQAGINALLARIEKRLTRRQSELRRC
jgi:RNA polymerase sigma factor (sigma-70 family)